MLLGREFVLVVFFGDVSKRNGLSGKGETYVHPYAKAINHGCQALGFHFKVAMREPNARPSNSSIFLLVDVFRE